MPTLRPSAPSNPEKPAPRATARSRAPVDPWSDTCPSRGVIGLLASKWVALLIPLLRRGPRRNGELMRGPRGSNTLSRPWVTRSRKRSPRSTIG